jgi:hypothetical protein
MKSNSELAEIGRLAALPVQVKTDAMPCMSLGPDHTSDAPVREAFAAAVAAEVRRECAETTRVWQQAATERENVLETRNQGLMRERDALQNIADKRQGEIAMLTANLEQVKKADPYAHLRAAYARGEKIECKAPKWEGWQEINHPAFDDPSLEYRVKPDKPEDPYAHLKAAWAAGKRIRVKCFTGTWGGWLSSARFDWTKPPENYEIEPDADTVPATANAALGVSINYDTYVAMCERLATLQSALHAEREVTAKLRKELEECRQQREYKQSEYDQVLEELREKSKIINEQRELHLATLAELKALRAELAKHQWRPVSEKPAKEDADARGMVIAFTKNGYFVTQDVNGALGAGCLMWLPAPKPPTPTAEEVKRAEFDKWYAARCADKSTHKTHLREAMFDSWQAARAGKEGL